MVEDTNSSKMCQKGITVTHAVSSKILQSQYLSYKESHWILYPWLLHLLHPRSFGFYYLLPSGKKCCPRPPWCPLCEWLEFCPPDPQGRRIQWGWSLKGFIPSKKQHWIGELWWDLCHSTAMGSGCVTGQPQTTWTEITAMTHNSGQPQGTLQAATN